MPPEFTQTFFFFFLFYFFSYFFPMTSLYSKRLTKELRGTIQLIKRIEKRERSKLNWIRFTKESTRRCWSRRSKQLFKVKQNMTVCVYMSLSWIYARWTLCLTGARGSVYEVWIYHYKPVNIIRIYHIGRKIQTWSKCQVV